MLTSYKVHWTPTDGAPRRTSVVSYDLPSAQHQQTQLEREGALDVEIEQITLR